MFQPCQPIIKMRALLTYLLNPNGIGNCFTHSHLSISRIKRFKLFGWRFYGVIIDFFGAVIPGKDVVNLAYFDPDFLSKDISVTE